MFKGTGWDSSNEDRSNETPFSNQRSSCYGSRHFVDCTCFTKENIVVDDYPLLDILTGDFFL